MCVITTDVSRCAWCCDGGILQEYHDTEWGIPVHDDRKQFEFLMMEAMQCGLNWLMMLKKRNIFRSCFDNFDFNKIAYYTDKDIERIMNVPEMIHSQRKIEAVIINAQKFIEIRKEYGSFSEWLWSFSDNKTINYPGHEKGEMCIRNELSDLVAQELKKRGFKYLGSITIYSHLEACGIIHDHAANCFMYNIKRY